MTTSKSPRRVLQVAYETACRALPAHRHKCSPKKYTQPQLLACLVLKEFSHLDYRSLAEHLGDHPDLVSQVGMRTVPHFTTFQKAAQRLLLATPARKIFDAVLERALRGGVRKRRVPLAAVDGTGLESRHTSRYYVKRRASGGDRDQITTYAKYPKVVFVVDCTSHMILAAVPGRGPGSDLVQFGAALGQAVRRARIGTLLADADFDAEWVHCGVRSHGIQTIIPPESGRPTDKLPSNRWWRMKQRFGQYKRKYGHRWQVEKVNSMLKRRLGSASRAPQYKSQCGETILRAITYNVMIISKQVFYRAVLDRLRGRLWPRCGRGVPGWPRGVCGRLWRGLVGDCVAKDAIKRLESVLDADFLAFAVRPAVAGDGYFIDPARARVPTILGGKREPRDLGRHLGLEAEPVALEVDTMDDLAAENLVTNFLIGQIYNYKHMRM